MKLLQFFCFKWIEKKCHQENFSIGAAETCSTKWSCRDLQYEVELQRRAVRSGAAETCSKKWSCRDVQYEVGNTFVRINISLTISDCYNVRQNHYKFCLIPHIILTYQSSILILPTRICHISTQRNDTIHISSVCYCPAQRRKIWMRNDS